MILPLSNVNNKNYQKFTPPKKNKTNLGFGSFVEPPLNFRVIKKNFLYKGGAIINDIEIIEGNNAYKKFNFLIAKNIKSILCFLDPKEDGYLIKEELDLIKNYNKNNPFSQINLEFLPCWVSKEEFDRNKSKYKSEFIRLINKLQSPIYMHCLAGFHIAEDMVLIFKEAVKKDKIIF